jgi:hypothetical protein
MAEQQPFEQYLQEVQTHLGGLSPEQRERVLRELQQHLDDAAHHAGAEPGDPQFQANLIDRLGPSRQLGHDLARAHRSPMAHRQRLVGGGAALCSVLTMLAAVPAAYLFRNQELLIDMLLAGPVVLAPTMLVLHIIYRPLRPRMSWWALGCGTFGLILLFLITIYPYLVELIELSGLSGLGLGRALLITRSYHFFSVLLLSLVGIWFFLIGTLSWTTRTPTTPEFGWVSMLTGGCYLAFLLGSLLYLSLVWTVGTVSPAVESIFRLIITAACLCWVLCHMTWAGIAAVWLLQRHTGSSASDDSVAAA